MAKCQVCGKGTKIGKNSKHHRGVSSRQFAHRAKKVSRTFKANIQKTTFMVGELKVRMKVCAKCLKAMKKKAVSKKLADKKKKTAKK
ncbi:50S ribosomal protein L28 [Candidatus Shapirobacteria bacterium]|nr:50S ribosomal protein L28 [Candidatus Shapirobacteria bacterium]